MLEKYPQVLLPPQCRLSKFFTLFPATPRGLFQARAIFFFPLSRVHSQSSNSLSDQTVLGEQHPIPEHHFLMTHISTRTQYLPHEMVPSFHCTREAGCACPRPVKLDAMCIRQRKCLHESLWKPGMIMTTLCNLTTRESEVGGL